MLGSVRRHGSVQCCSSQMLLWRHNTTRSASPDVSLDKKRFLLVISFESVKLSGYIGLQVH